MVLIKNLETFFDKFHTTNVENVPLEIEDCSFFDNDKYCIVQQLQNDSSVVYLTKILFSYFSFIYGNCRQGVSPPICIRADLFMTRHVL